MTEAPRAARTGILAATFSHADLAQFDTIIDARSPAEFTLDHIPGAINLPVLDDEERHRVGTIYKQESAFAAKRLGAGLVAANIARHLSERLNDFQREWRPLVYCWRGGNRSGAFAHVLRQIGWRAFALEGGYQSYRQRVRADLDLLPANFHFKVVCGRTGSGKSRLLQALTRAGAQALDLEELAAHRGSVLGDLPDAPQPAQKAFESGIWAALYRFDPSRPVFVEAESKRIGQLRVPDTLMERMRAAHCVMLETEFRARVSLLREDYEHLIANPTLLQEKLACLEGLHPAAKIEAWLALAHREAWDELVADLLENHYDPAYLKSMHRNYARLAQAQVVPIADASNPSLARLAQTLAGAD